MELLIPCFLLRLSMNWIVKRNVFSNWLDLNSTQYTTTYRNQWHAKRTQIATRIGDTVTPNLNYASAKMVPPRILLAMENEEMIVSLNVGITSFVIWKQKYACVLSGGLPRIVILRNVLLSVCLMVLSVSVCMGQKMEDVENVDRIVDNMQLVKNEVSNKVEDIILTFCYWHRTIETISIYLTFHYEHF